MCWEGTGEGSIEKVARRHLDVRGPELEKVVQIKFRLKIPKNTHSQENLPSTTDTQKETRDQPGPTNNAATKGVESMESYV